MSNKKLVKDVLFALPLGIIYIFFINKILELLTADLVYEQKNKRKIAVSFITVIVGFVLAFKIFGRGKLKNRIIKYSLIFGSTIILFNSIIYQWPQLKTDTKTLLIGILLVLGFLLSYKVKGRNKKNTS
jgi:hypothetical protein